MIDVFVRLMEKIKNRGRKTGPIWAAALLCVCLLCSCGPEPGMDGPPGSAQAGMFGQDNVQPQDSGAVKGEPSGSGSAGSTTDQAGGVQQPGPGTASDAVAEKSGTAPESGAGKTSSAVAQGTMERLDAGELADISEYLNREECYGFLLSSYEEPEDIDLSQVFYDGAGFPQEELEKKEKKLLTERLSQKKLTEPVIRVTEEQIDQLLSQKAGITYEESNRQLEGQETWAHIGRYQSWYSVHEDHNRREILCTDGWKRGSAFIIHYSLGRKQEETHSDPASEDRSSMEKSSLDKSDNSALGKSSLDKSEDTDPENPALDKSDNSALGKSSLENETAAAFDTDGDGEEAGVPAQKDPGKVTEEERAEGSATAAGSDTDMAADDTTGSKASSAEVSGTNSPAPAEEAEKTAFYDPVYELQLQKTEDGWRFCSNILWIQKDLIETQSYRADLDPDGEVFFAPVYPDTSVDEKADVSFVLVKDGGLLAELSAMEDGNIRTGLVFQGVDAVDFTDYNRDGFEDIFTICSYRTVSSDGRRGNEIREARVYTGRAEEVPFLDRKKTEMVNSQVETLNISNITRYLTGKSNGKDKKYSSWKEAFTDHIKNVDEEEYDGFALIYLNDDRVPELVQIGATPAKGSTVVVYRQGALQETWLNRRDFLYLEYENLLLSASGVENLHYDTIYSIVGGKLGISVQGYYGNKSFARVQFDDNGREVYDYVWDGGTVSKNGYQDGIMFLFDAARARTSGAEELMTAEDLLKELQ